MKYFTIDSENSITVHSSRQAARDTGAGVFSNEVQLADLIGPDNKRLLEIWNSLPGVRPVTKFTDRKVATQRIWKAIQNLGGPAATEPAPAPEAAPAPEPSLAPEATALPDSPTETDAIQAAPAIEAPPPEVTSEPTVERPEATPVPETQHEATTPAAEQQLDSEQAPSQTQEPGVAPVETAQQTTPFDEPGAEPQATSEPAAGQPEVAPEPDTATAEPEVVANADAQGAQVAPTEAPATKKATRAKKAPTGETNASVPREGSKTSRVIEMLRREGGVTLEEIMAEMGWLKHTARSMMSAGGSLAKKHGLVVTSEKVGDKRTYRILQ